MFDFDCKDVKPGSACDTCGHFACVCEIRKAHEDGCPFKKAATCAIPIACEPHGRDTCPVCDKCTCKSPEAQADEDARQNWRKK